MKKPYILLLSQISCQYRRLVFSLLCLFTSSLSPGTFVECSEVAAVYAASATSPPVYTQLSKEIFFWILNIPPVYTQLSKEIFFWILNIPSVYTQLSSQEIFFWILNIPSVYTQLSRKIFFRISNIPSVYTQLSKHIFFWISNKNPETTGHTQPWAPSILVLPPWTMIKKNNLESPRKKFENTVKGAKNRRKIF